eukprot:114890-Rhodomonas_salina.1
MAEGRSGAESEVEEGGQVTLDWGEEDSDAVRATETRQSTDSSELGTEGEEEVEEGASIGELAAEEGGEDSMAGQMMSGPVEQEEESGEPEWEAESMTDDEGSWPER